VSDFATRAEAFGAKDYFGSVRIPAARLVDFLVREIELGHRILYFECLYFHEPAGTEPSMELSCELESVGSVSNLLAQARECAPLAIERAAAKGATAYFEVAGG
jgi:hypothetical protein